MILNLILILIRILVWILVLVLADSNTVEAGVLNGALDWVASSITILILIVTLVLK